MSDLTCEHGVGHSASVHGCDGCCQQFYDQAADQLLYYMGLEVNRLAQYPKTDYMRVEQVSEYFKLFIAYIRGEGETKE